MSVAHDRFDATETFQLAIEASPAGVLVIDAAGTIHLVNAELERQFGYARGELLGRNVDLLVPEALQPVDHSQPQSFGDALVARPIGAGPELFGRRKDGSAIAVEIGLKPIQTADGRFVVATVVDVSERRRMQDAQRSAIEGQLEFERFVAELSFQFINLPANEVIDVIRYGLRRIGQEANLDRALFLRISPDGILSDVITWSAGGVPPVELPDSAKTRFPWASERVAAGELVAFSSLTDVPSEIDRETLRTIGTKSGIYIPLSVDGRVTGAVGFTTVRAERSWPPELVHRLKVFASVFEQGLARQQRDEAMLSATREVQRLKDRLHDGERLPAPGRTRPAGAGRHRRTERGHPAGTGANPSGGGHRLDGAPARGNGNRKGTLRDASPRTRKPPGADDGAGQLRSDSGDAHRKRVVRAGERRVHGGAVAPGRSIRAGGPLDDLSRRDRRPAGRSAGQAPAGAGRAPDRAAGKPAPDLDRHPDHRRDPSKSRAADWQKGRFARICTIG